jgi:putative FmdB family regulatory protein
LAESFCLFATQNRHRKPRRGKENPVPFYDYECRECQKTFTRQESFEEHDCRSSLKCPECGSRKIRQLVPAAHVQTSKKS